MSLSAQTEQVYNRGKKQAHKHVSIHNSSHSQTHIALPRVFVCVYLGRRFSHLKPAALNPEPHKTLISYKPYKPEARNLKHKTSIL